MDADLWQSFEQVHVVSDLHLGGQPGFQIFHLSNELTALIDHLRELPSKSLALVINGDFVDFLAERVDGQQPVYFDPFDAAARLPQILSDQRFPGVLSALTRFVGTKGRTLIVNVGNHDLELAVPFVRERFCSLVTGDDPAKRGRLKVVSDGTGVRCRVGTMKVFCIHGNEADGWNVSDHEAIRRIGRDLSMGHGVDRWVPNAGTQLVIDVMNGIKRTHPFVDLLKPECGAVVPTLVAIDPSVLSRIPNLAPAGARGVYDRVRSAIGLLGEEEAPAGTERFVAPAQGNVATRVPSPYARGFRHEQREKIARSLLDDTEQQIKAGQDAMELLAPGVQGESLGLVRAVWNLARGDRTEALREALQRLEKDRTFEFNEGDPSDAKLDTLVGSDIDVVVAGHTHLARSLPRACGRGRYFNCGTWARLIRFPPEIVKQADGFGRVLTALRAGTIDALDSEPGLVLNRPTVVSVTVQGTCVNAELRQFSSTPSPRFERLGDSYVRG